jgi:hypothetical protein
MKLTWINRHVMAIKETEDMPYSFTVGLQMCCIPLRMQFDATPAADVDQKHCICTLSYIRTIDKYTLPAGCGNVR